MGRGSGLDSIRLWLQKLGQTASDEQIAQILVEVKKFGYAHKRLLSEEEFRDVANSDVANRVLSLLPV
jgi:isopropylmalate/homocitrate/citramalate synthase